MFERVKNLLDFTLVVCVPVFDILTRASLFDIAPRVVRDIPLCTSVGENCRSQCPHMSDGVLAVFPAEFFEEIRPLKRFIPSEGFGVIEMILEIRIPVTLITLDR